MAEAVEAWIAEAAQFVSLLVTVLEPKFVAPETDYAGVSWLTFCQLILNTLTTCPASRFS